MMRVVVIFLCAFFCIHKSIAQNNVPIQASSQQGCVPLSVSFSTSLKNVRKYKWEFSNGTVSIIQQPTILFEQPGRYDVKLLVEYEDNKSEEFTFREFIEVKSAPEANFSISHHEFCDGDSIHFINESVGATSYIWNFGDGINSKEKNPTHVYKDKGIYSVTLLTYNQSGCPDIKHIEGLVKINKIENLDFLANETTLCTNNPSVKFSQDQEFQKYHWDFGDGHTSEEKSPVHDYLKPGKFNVFLRVEDKNGCTSELVKKNYIVSNMPPQINIEISDNLICSHESIEFTNRTPHTKELLWQFDNGFFSKENKFSYTFTAPDTLDLFVYLKDKNNCEQTKAFPQKIIVAEAAETVIQISDTEICTPGIVNFTNSTKDAISYTWEIGNKVYNGKSIDLTFVQEGAITVKAITGHLNGCVSEKKIDSAVVINQSDIYAEASAYAGCLPFESSFNLSSTEIHDILWDFGDGETASGHAPTKIFSKPGKYEVKVSFINQFGCAETIKLPRTIDVHDNAVNYKIPEPIQVCTFEEVKFSGNSGKSGWKWNFGDGHFSNEKDPVHQYKIPGAYNVSLEMVNANGCPVKIDKYLDVNVTGGQPVEFELSMDQCVDSMVLLRSLGPDSFTYHWELDNGVKYTGQVVQHDFERSGYYPVKLTTVDSFGCKMIQLRNEYIHYEPCLNITYMPGQDSAALIIRPPEIRVTNPGITQACSAPFQISFQNPLAKADYWLWKFDDGATSVEMNPTHEYAEPGLYTVDLIAFYDNGTIDTVAGISVIEVLDQKVDFSFSTQATCDGYQVTFEDQSVDPVAWLWNFGDSTISEKQNPIKSFGTEGQYQVSLVTVDTRGCVKRTVHNVSVGNPYFYFDFDPEVCAGETITINHNIEGFEKYTWTFGDGAQSFNHFPSHSFAHAGVFSIQLEAEALGNCKKIFESNNAVLVSGPFADFEILGESIGCDNLNVKFKNLSTESIRWNWDFGNGITSTEKDPVVDFRNGLFTVKLTAYNESCEAFTIRENVIDVRKPKADFTFIQDNSCFPVTIEFKDQSTDANKWSWDFGDGNTSGEQHPVYTYYQLPKKNIKLTIETDNGCKSTVSQEIPEFHYTVFDAKKRSGCIPFNVSFIDKTKDAVSWYWTFGDGSFSTEKNPSHIFENEGNYTVSLVTSSGSGCVDTLTMNDFIKVGVLSADFSVDVPPSLCSPLFAQFHNNSEGADTYIWNFGDGSASTLKDPVHIYTKVGEFNVNLIAKNQYGCSDTASVTNLVRILGPEADFSLSDTSLCHPQELRIVDKSASATKWEWFFGDGATSELQHPVHQYEEPGQYKISMIATDKYGCRELKSIDPVRVIPMPQAKFSVQSVEYCYPARIEVDNTSENLQNVAYLWEFGDGRTSDIKTPEIQYQLPGTYKVRLTAVNDQVCKNQFELSEVIHVRDTFRLKEALINELTVLRHNQININMREYERNNFKYYVVYRKSGKDSEYSVIDSIFNSNQTIYSDYNVVTDQNDYLYKFQAHVHCNIPLPINKLNTYKSILLNVTPEDGSMALKWLPYSGHSFESYSIMRSDASGNWEEIAHIPHGQRSYVDHEALCPEPHMYKVVANKLDGLNYFSMSNSVTAKPMKNLFLDQKTDIVRTTVVGDKGILTEWNDPSIGIERVRSYKIWKSANDGEFIPVYELPKGVNSFLDTDVIISAQRYQYKITVENSCEVMGKPSNLGSSILLKKNTDHYLNSLTWTPYLEWKEGVGEYILQKRNPDGEWESVRKFSPDVNSFHIDLSDD